MSKLNNTFIIIGTIIITFFMVISIGMCFAPFRDKVYKTLKVVPEQELKENEMDVDILNQNIQDKLTQIKALKDEKIELENKKNELQTNMDNLNSINEIQKEELVVYEKLISNLNKDIERLENEVKDISKTMQNITIKFKKSYDQLFMPFFREDGQYAGHGAIMETKYENSVFTKVNLLNTLNHDYAKIKQDIISAVGSQYATHYETVEVYTITIKGKNIDINYMNEGEFYMDNQATITTELYFHDTQTTVESIESLLEDGKEYKIELKFSPSINDKNLVTDLIVKTIIKEI